jgi:hypothetical protein
MCIANLDGFDMDWAMEAQRDAQIETSKTFGNLKRTDIFKVAEKIIKQMKRLQNPKMVDGDDRNDMEDMEDMEHQGENKNHVLTTTKKNPNKNNNNKIKRMLIEAMAIHETLVKNFNLKSNLKKKKGNITFPNTFDFGSEYDE